MAMERRPVEGCGASHRGGLHARVALIAQCPNHITVPTFGGHVKRCVSLSARRLDINMTLNQQPHYLEVAYMCGEVQGRLAVLVSG